MVVIMIMMVTMMIMIVVPVTVPVMVAVAVKVAAPVPAAVLPLLAQMSPFSFGLPAALAMPMNCFLKLLLVVPDLVSAICCLCSSSGYCKC